MGKRTDFYKAVADELGRLADHAPTRADRHQVWGWMHRALALAATAEADETTPASRPPMAPAQWTPPKDRGKDR